MKQEITKKLFENALRAFLVTSSFKKITVQNIVDYCGFSRQTFYQHFKDKYDLVAWIYQCQSSVIINKFPQITWLEVAINVLSEIEKDCSFYTKVLANDEENLLINYMVAYDLQIYGTMLKTLGRIETIDDQLAFDMQFHAYACAHMTQAWIKKKVRERPEEYAKKLLHAMPPRLFEAIPNRGL